ncbi:MAG: hemerythrin [Comamonadaceae bacterium]|nr:MAG: hemerythrin [Comamonadaceae bacterium]
MTDQVHQTVPNSSPRKETDPGQRVWTDARLLGHDELDATHKEFYEVVFRMLTCNENTALTTLLDFEEHAQAHFWEEEDWMRETAFPAAQCHADEHRKVLASLAEVKHAVSTNVADQRLVQRFADHLFAWFPGHADYMDSALSTWLNKKRFGAKPVVFKRLAVA